MLPRLGYPGRYVATHTCLIGQSMDIELPTITVPVGPSAQFLVELDLSIERLRQELATVTFHFHINGELDYIEIHSNRGRYLAVTSCMMLVDKRKPLTDAMTGMGCGESLIHNTVENLDMVKTLVSHFVEHGKYEDKDPFVWVDLSSDEAERRFNFDGVYYS